jgi:hypothetical protein
MTPPPPSHSAAGVTVVGPASALGAAFAVAATTSSGRTKMSAIIEAVVFGVMLLTYPAYPHPTSCSGEAQSGVEREGVLVEEDHLSMSSRDVDKSNIPVLPPELYSIIAYYLHVPPSTTETLLKSCSLVSSAWLTASRMYTFRTVKLTYANVYRFLTLLEDPRCSFKCCVRRLEMREGEYAVDRWINDVLPRLVLDGRMRRMEILDVYNLTWAELSPQAVRALTEGFAAVGKEEEGEKMTKIKSLRVGTCYWECVHDFVGFVCSPSFVALKTLVCDSVLLNCGMGSCQCRDAGEGPAETVVVRDSGTLNSSREQVPPEISRALECLYLGLPEEKMLKWFVKEDAVCGIEKLGLVVRERALMELVGRFVGRATKVKEMALDLPSGQLNLDISPVSAGTDTKPIRLWFVIGEQHSIKNTPRNGGPVFIFIIVSDNIKHIEHIRRRPYMAPGSYILHNFTTYSLPYLTRGYNLFLHWGAPFLMALERLCQRD